MTYIPGSAETDSGEIVYNEEMNQLEWTGNIPPDGTVKISYDTTADTGVNFGQIITDIPGTVSYDSDGDGVNDTTGETDGNPDEPGNQPAQIMVNGGKIQVAAVKTAVNTDGSSVFSGDEIEYTVILKNESGYVIEDAEYSDTVPGFADYVPGSLIIPDGSIADQDFPNLRITGITIPAGGDVKIVFRAEADISGKVLPADAGEIKAGEGILKYDTDGNGTNDAVTETDNSEADISLIIPYATCTPSGISFTTAQLNGILNPQGSQATYWFEYGTTEDYGMTTPEIFAGAGYDNIYVNEYLEYLNENTEYHYRLVTKKNGIISYGADAVFTTAYTETGSDGIHKDSSLLKSWATGYEAVKYGKDFSSDRFKKPENAIGKADADQSSGFVSLGTGGSIVLTFRHPVTDGAGYDFAVFAENFNDTALDLAFVEVSSDGLNFIRFDNVSLNTPESFGAVDSSKIDGFAGKYRTGYGTAFDLSRLSGKPETENGTVNLKRITHVRISDAVYGKDTDSHGNIIYDAYYYRTLSRAGFDLEAIGVIHEACDYGDVNGDGEVNLKDAVDVMKLMTGISAGEICISADVNGDMQIGIEDLLYVLRKTAD